MCTRRMDGPHVQNIGMDGPHACRSKQDGYTIGMDGSNVYNRDGWFHVHNRNGTPTGDSF